MTDPGAGFQFPRKVVPRKTVHELMQTQSLNMAYVREWLKGHGIELAPSTAGYGSMLESGPPHWHVFNPAQNAEGKEPFKMCFQIGDFLAVHTRTGRPVVMKLVASPEEIESAFEDV